MARGTPGVKRTRTISVRVSQEEWQAWEARRERSGRAEMGAWVRAVVTDADVDGVGDEAVGAGVDRGVAGDSSPACEPAAETSSQDSPAARPPRRVAGDRPVVPEVNERAYAVLVGAANNLNQLTRFSHQIQALVPGIEAAMAEVVAASRAVRGIVVTSSPRSTSKATSTVPTSRVPGSAGVRTTSRGATSEASRRRPARAGGFAGGGAVS